MLKMMVISSHVHGLSTRNRLGFTIKPFGHPDQGTPNVLDSHGHSWLALFHDDQ